ncbi:MAG TPA: putative baseplate assembly protein [Bryobacteraceae bacterium]|nr:putative baseplate assembly protein [Bryobacteraceae bacterium]
MYVPLPNLDDRRWSDLTDEARSLLPVYAPAWTDYNASDPGITLMELMAWVTDADIYRANRIPDAHTLAFLALIGIAPLPAIAARGVVQFALKARGAALSLPSTTELDAPMLDGNQGKFRLVSPISVLPAAIAAVQVQSGGIFRDVTGDWTHGKPLAVFGTNPQPGDALYLGFSGTFNSGDLLSVYIGLQGETASRAARQAILDEIRSRMKSCPPPLTCKSSGVTQPPAAAPALPPHYSASVVWEAQTEPGVWTPINAIDDTRAMTLSGSVTLTMAPPAPVRTGNVTAPLGYIRCRLASGSLDAAPVALRILENAAEAEQATPAWQTWPIAAGVAASGAAPTLGSETWVALTFDAPGNISSLRFLSAEDPAAISVVVLAYQPATGTKAGSLTVEAALAGTGTGAPNQLYQLQGPELCADSLKVYTIESSGVKRWSSTGSFTAAGAADTSYVVDSGDAEILFGDGQNGRVPPAGSAIIVVARVTNGAAGNAAAGAITALDAGPHNAALFDVAAVAGKLQRIANTDAAAGGSEPETIEHAEGRAALVVEEADRAVTLADCEALALATPGTKIARAAAIANYCPSLPCYLARGFITVIIVPSLPTGRPVPSAGLLATVSGYLNRRRVIGTRIEVIGPDYLEVSVTATLKAVTGQNKTAVHDAAIAALKQFLDPLAGGPDGTGWPLGRAVYVSEILETLDTVPGVDYVASLELTAADCGPQCGDICLDPIALAVSGSHTIQVN